MSIGSWVASFLTGSGGTLAALVPAAERVSLQVIPYTAGLVALTWTLLRAHQRWMRSAACARQEKALRKELLAYLLFNGSPRSMVPIEFGRQVSRLVAGRSSFSRAALLLRDETGVLRVTGSCGFDDLSVDALHRWGWAVSAAGGTVEAITTGGEPIATSSFTHRLERREADRGDLSRMVPKSVHMVPLRTAGGLLGALVVCAEPRSSACVIDPLELGRPPAAQTILPLADLLQPLEALALRVTMQLTAPEDMTPLWPAGMVPRRARAAGSAAMQVQPALMAAPAPEGDLADAIAVGGPAGARLATPEQVRHMLRAGISPGERAHCMAGRPPARIWRRGAEVRAM